MAGESADLISTATHIGFSGRCKGLDLERTAVQMRETLACGHHLGYRRRFFMPRSVSPITAPAITGPDHREHHSHSDCTTLSTHSAYVQECPRSILLLREIGNGGSGWLVTIEGSR